MAKAKQKSLTINLILNGLFSMSAYLFPMVALPYASRILQPAGVGRVSFATSIIAYFIMVAQLGIPTYGIQACAKVKDDREKLSRTVQELFIISIVMDIIVYAALAVALINVPRLSQDKILFVVLSINILFRSIGMEWLYRALEQYEAITLRAVIFQLLSIAALVTLVKDESDYIIYAFLTVAATQGAGIINFIQARKLIDIKPLWKYDFKRHLKAVAVFFAMACAIMIYTNLDISMIGFIKGDTEVGYYNVAVKIKLVLVTLITTIGTVLLPRTSYYYVKGMEREFRETCKKAMHGVIIIALPVALYFIIFAKESIMLISGSAFMPSVIPMMIIMLTLPFIGMTNIMGIQMLASMGKEKCTLISVVAGAAADFILNIILIPVYGAAGAAAGTLAAEIVVWIVQYIFILRYIGNIYQHINCFKVIAACVAGAVLSYIAKTMSCPDIIVLIVSAVIFFGVYAVVLVMAKDEMALEIVGKFAGTIKKINKNNEGEQFTMKIKNYYLKSIADDMFRHWKIVVALVVVFTAVFGVLGYKKSNIMQNLTPEQQSEVDAYNEMVDSYDAQIKQCEENMKVAEQQRDEYKKYVDNSIYMKLDGQNIQVSTLEYAVYSDNAWNILCAMQTYVNTSGLKEKLIEKYGDEGNNMNEVIGCSITGNSFDVTVSHYDKDKSVDIRDTIAKCLEDYKSEITSIHGDFELKKVSTSDYVNSDVNVTNTQNSNNENLKNLETNITNIKSSIASNMDAKKNYIENNKPEVMEASAPGKKLIITYAIFGIILGIVLPFVIFSIRYVLSSRVRSARELERSGMSVFMKYNDKEEYSDKVKQTAIDISVMLKKNNADTLFIDTMSSEENVISFVDKFVIELDNVGIKASALKEVGKSADDTKEIIEKGYGMVLLKAGENTYPQLTEHLGIHERYGAEILGSIVAE